MQKTEVYIPVLLMRMAEMNSFSLLFARIQQNWRFQYGLFKAVSDWTIMVYLVIPAIVIGAAVYRSWWVDIPYWIEGIPYEILFVLFFFFLWNGHFHTFVREADGIFLMKNESLLLGLKQGGIIYTSILELLSAMFLAFVISPFWIKHFEMSIVGLILFHLMWVSLKWLVMAVKGKMNILVKGWRNIFRSMPLAIMAFIIWYVSYRAFTMENTFFMMSIIMLNVLVTLKLIKKRFTSIRTFERDLVIDEMEKIKYITLILGMSMDMEKLSKPTLTRRKPRLYSRSNRIFKERTSTKGFLELFIKATTRNSEYILGFLKITGITAAAIIAIPPIWFKITIICFGYIFLISWIGNVWNKLIGEHPFTKKYVGDDGYLHGKRAVTIILSIPFIVVIICALIIRIWISSLFSFL